MIADKKKGRSKSFGPLLKNYFAFGAALAFGAASKWIANFGVVPLFLLAAFLLAPAFFAFLNLLFSVTHVLETIGQLLYNRYIRDGINSNILILYRNQKFKPYFLPIFNPCVKGIFSFLFLIPTLSWSSDFILSRGQSMELQLPRMEKFNIGNKDVLSYRFNENNKTLLIRGSKLGTSEILVWEKGESRPLSHQVSVISKVQEVKFLHLAQLLSALELTSKVVPPHLKVSGELKTLSQYQQYKKIQSAQEAVILDETTLASSLKKDIFAEIYQVFFSSYKDSINCQAHTSVITCFYSSSDGPLDALKKHLSGKYQIDFVEINEQKLQKNYSFKLKLIQIEQLDGEELRLGLEQLSSSLGELLHVPINRIVEKNSVLLANKKVQVSTLAEPVGIIRPQTPAEFQVGADIPYSVTSKDGVTNTEWQFAGLKVLLKLENFGEKLKIDYETSLSRPSDQNDGAISGNKNKSSLTLNLNEAIQLFQITLKTEANTTERFPFISRIPILGELFKSKSSQNNYKMITAILEVQENE